MKLLNLKSFKLFLLAGLLACGLVPALASATPVTFDINGHYDLATSGPRHGDFTGTMQVDTSTGDLLAFEVLFPGVATFDDIVSSGGSKRPPQWTVQATNAWLGFVSLTFTTPQIDGFRKRGSLIGFDGGSIVGDGEIDWFLFGTVHASFSGDITPARLSVPEPAALGMFGLGVLLIGGLSALRRRSYKLTP